jgi:hypothetical protein
MQVVPGARAGGQVEKTGPDKVSIRAPHVGLVGLARTLEAPSRAGIYCLPEEGF